MRINWNYNPAADIDLGVNPDDKSRFSVVMSRSVTVTHQGITRLLQETLANDQHDNYMLIYSCDLRDGEKYDWHDWVKPSMFDICGGWNDNLFTYYRRRAMEALAKSESQIENEKISVNNSAKNPDTNDQAHRNIIPLPLIPTDYPGRDNFHS